MSVIWTGIYPTHDPLARLFAILIPQSQQPQCGVAENKVWLMFLADDYSTFLVEESWDELFSFFTKLVPKQVRVDRVDYSENVCGSRIAVRELQNL
jgi:hypothetical protein